MQGVETPLGMIWNGATVPALCLDLDGTVRYSKSGEFLNGPSDVALFPGVEEKIWEWRNKGYLIFGVSNQGGVAFGYKTVRQAEAELDATLALFKKNPFHIVKQCYHHEKGKVFPYNKRSLCRKPAIGMLALMELEAFEAGYLVDWDNSLFIGDRPEDEECARSAGIRFQWAKDFFGWEAQEG